MGGLSIYMLTKDILLNVYICISTFKHTFMTDVLVITKNNKVHTVTSPGCGTYFANTAQQFFFQN